MTKFLKPGKVVVVLNGKYAGKKAVIMKVVEEGTKERPYAHCLVVGIERYPLRVTKAMNQKKIARRSKVKPFIKVINLSHVMPTRYAFELEGVKEVVDLEIVKDPTQKRAARKTVKKLLEERYNSGKNKWFFQKLRF